MEINQTCRVPKKALTRVQIVHFFHHIQCLSKILSECKSFSEKFLKFFLSIFFKKLSNILCDRCIYHQVNTVFHSKGFTSFPASPSFVLDYVQFPAPPFKAFYDFYFNLIAAALIIFRLKLALSE